MQARKRWIEDGYKTEQNKLKRYFQQQFGYQNLRSRFGIERYAYTDSYNGQIPCVCMYVCDQTPPKPLNRFA